jgi:HEAT repeat protein
VALWKIDRRGKEAVPVLAAALALPDRAARVEAARAVAQIGPAAAEAAPGLVGLLASGDADLVSLGRGLAAIGDPAVPHLVKALGHEDRVVRRTACELLGRCLAPGPDVPAALRGRLADEDGRTRVKAAEVFWVLARDGDAVGPPLAKALAGEDSFARGEALRVLAFVRPLPGDVVPPLERLLEEGPPAERSQAAELLRARDGIPGDAPGPPAPVGDLVAVCADKEAAPAAAWAAATALGRAGEAGVKEALKLLGSPDARLHPLGLQALAAAGPAARPAVPRLADALKDPDAAVRRKVAAVLGSLGPDAAAAGPALAEAVKDPDPVVRNAVLVALRQIRPDPCRPWSGCCAARTRWPGARPPTPSPRWAGMPATPCRRW